MNKAFVQSVELVNMASWSSLPADLQVDILARLPVKILLQVRSVCKAWLTTISSPSFTKTHLDHSYADPNNTTFIAHSYQANTFPNHSLFLIHLDNLENPITLEHPFPNSISPADMEVVGSCNGLLCLTNSLNHICLWNPATKQVHDISNFGIDLVDATGEVSVGFGFDRVANDYKVVRIVWTSRSKSCRGRVEVYSLNQNSWREIEVEVDFELIHGTCRIIVKGNPYWMGLAHRWEVKKQFFVSFDVHNEAFIKIPWPDHIVRRQGLGTFVEFEESFGIILGKTNQGRISEFSIWTLDDNHRIGGAISWTKKLDVGPVLEMSRLLGHLKNGQIIAEKVVERHLVLYDPITEEIQPTQVRMRTLECHNYVESLVI